MPPVILAVAAAAAAYGAATAVGLAVGTLAFAVFSSLVAAAIDAIGSMLLAPHPSNNSAAGATQNNTLNIRSAISTHKIIYGQVRVGASLTFWDTSPDNSIVYLIYTLACHPVAEIGAVYFNDTLIPLDSSGQAQTPPLNPDGTTPQSYEGSAQIIKGLGTVAGDINFNTILQTGSKKWTDNCRQYDRAKLLAVLTWNQSAYGAGGLPQITAFVKGRPIFDMRNTGVDVATVTAGAPGVITTSSAHDCVPGDLVWFQNVTGTAPEIDQEYQVGSTPTSTTLTLLGTNSLDLTINTGSASPGGTLTRMTWSDNSTLCGNDYVCDPIYGFNALYSTEIPASVQIASANNCDELVAIAPLLTSTFIESLGFMLLPTLGSGADPIVTLGMPFTVSSTGTLPAPLAAATVYYAVPKGDLQIAVATTLANAAADLTVSLTTAGSGTHTMTQVEPFSAQLYTTEPDWLQATDNLARITTGTRVTVSGASLPTPLAPATEYFAILVSDMVFKLADTLDDARQGIFIPITSVGAGFVIPDAEPRYTCNGVIDTSNTRQDNMNALLSSMGGYLVPNGVALGLYSAVYRTPTVILTEDDFDGPVSVQTLNSGQVSFNCVRGQFQDPFSSGLPTDLPSLQNQSYIDADQGETVFKDVDLGMTNSSSMGQRLFNIELERVRRELTTTLACKLTAFQVSVPDVIGVTFDRWGWADETFEVQNWKMSIRNAGGGAGGDPYLGVDIIGRQTDANVFAWNTTQQLPQKSWVNTTLPNAFKPAPPTSMVLNSGAGYLFVQQDGTVFPQLVISWAAPADQFVQNGGFIETQYALTGTSDWQKGPIVPGDDTVANILNVQVGTAYDVRIRSQNGLGVYSDPGAVWVETITNYTILGPNSGPAPPTALTIAGTIAGGALDWTLPADPSVATTEIWSNTVDNRATAVKWGNVAGNTFPLTGLTPGTTYYVWTRCVDRSGNIGAGWFPSSSTGGVSFTANAAGSADITPGSITTTLIATGAATITSLSVNPGFQGNLLSWTAAASISNSHTEIWRSASSSFGSAAKIGTAPANSTTWLDGANNLASDTPYWYWVRSVDYAGNLGAYDPSSGGAGATATTVLANYPDLATGAATSQVGNSGGNPISNVITTIGGNVALWWGFYTPSAGNFVITVTRDATNLLVFNSGLVGGFSAASLIDNPGAGSHTYTLTITRTSGSGGISVTSLITIELRR